jgi:hypothetical protein
MFPGAKSLIFPGNLGGTFWMKLVPPNQNTDAHG